MPGDDEPIVKAGMHDPPPRRPDGLPNIPDHETVRLIGRGSYGEVWLARNAVGTWRAVKVVYRDRFKDAIPYEREFIGIKKYEPISRSHEGLVDVLQIGRNDAEGYFYCVMELADDANTGQGASIKPNGPSLERHPTQMNLQVESAWKPFQQCDPATYTPRTLSLDLIRHGRLSLDECVALGLKLNLALGHLHRNGLIHRDVKPPNIIFVNGVPKLADIGLVTELSGANSFVGTEGYVAPEGPNSPQADLYALGKVLYEVSTGKDRYEFPSPLTGYGNDSDAKALKEMHAVVLRACETSLKKRYRSAEEMNADLALLHSGKSVQQKHAVERRLKITTRVAAVAVAVIVLAVFPYYLAIKEAREEAKQRELAQASEKKAEDAKAGEFRARLIAEQRLYDSLLGQARATRMAHRVGYRDKVFSLIKQANALDVPQKDLADLRREAVACLGDFVGLTPTTISDFPTDTSIRRALLDPTGMSAAFLLGDGTVILRQLPSGTEITSFQLSGDWPTRSICFNSSGSQLMFVRMPERKQLEDRIPDARVNVWTRGAHNQWRETENVTLPGALDCLSTSRGLFVTTFTELPGIGKLLNATTKELVWQFDCPQDWIPEVTLSPDGQLLATETAESPNEVEAVLDIWNVDTGERLARLTPRFGVLKSLCFSPNGKYLMCSGESSGAIYEVRGFNRVSTFNVRARVPLVFAPGGEVVAIPISQEYRISLWDWIRNEELAALDEPKQANKIDFTPDGSLMLTVSLQEARVYHLDKTPEKLSLRHHLGNRTGVAFSPDGLRIATAGLNPAVRVCDSATGSEIWKSDGVPIQGHAPVFSRDGRWLAAADFVARRAYVWDATTGERLLEVLPEAGGRLWSVQFSPDSRYFITGSGTTLTNGHGLELWAIEEREPGATGGRLQARRVRAVGSSAWSVACSPDGQLLAYVDRDLDGVYVLDLARQTAARCVSTNLIHRIGNDQSLSFTPDSRRLLMVDSTRAVHVLDAVTGEPVSTFKTVDPKRTPAWTHSAGISLSPDGFKLAMVSASGCGVDLWDQQKHQLLYSLPETGDTVHWLAWSSCSQRLAITRSNGDIEVWELKQIEENLTKLALNP